MYWHFLPFKFLNVAEQSILITGLTNILIKYKLSYSKDLGLHLIIKITELEISFHLQF